MKKFKIFFSLLLAILMITALCVPAAAYDPDTDSCNCEEPWPENPENVGDIYIISYGPNAHIWAQDHRYQCSQCGGDYTVKADQTWWEAHNYEHISHIDGILHTCVDCEYQYFEAN